MNINFQYIHRRIVQCIGDFYFEEDNDFGPDDDFDEISDSLFEDFFKEFGKESPDFDKLDEQLNNKQQNSKK